MQYKDKVLNRIERNCYKMDINFRHYKIKIVFYWLKYQSLWEIIFFGAGNLWEESYTTSNIVSVGFIYCWVVLNGLQI